MKGLLRISQFGVCDYSHRQLPITAKTVLGNFEQLASIDFHNENVMLEGFGDVHPFKNPPRFPKAKTIFMESNYKYFHYYWLDRKTFPLGEKFYINGHPCDNPVLERGLQLYFVDNNYDTAIRYSPNNPDIHFISKNDYYKMLEEYIEEDPFGVNRKNISNDDTNVTNNSDKDFGKFYNKNNGISIASYIYENKE